MTSCKASAPILEADIRYCRNGFALEARFTLRSPWTVLFGPSGAGKTTLLRLLAGLTAPESGRIVIGGRVLTDTAAQVSITPGVGTDQRKIGFVTQQPALFPHLTARANVTFGLASLAHSERDERVAGMLKLFDAQALAERKPLALSGGERQRIALARALAPQPDLLLLDEPFAALDAAARSMMIEALRSSGVPVLYVSHDLADAWQANAEALALEAGRIVAQGDARIVLAGYRERLLAQLGVDAAVFRSAT